MVGTSKPYMNKNIFDSEDQCKIKDCSYVNYFGIRRNHEDEIEPDKADLEQFENEFREFHFKINQLIGSEISINERVIVSECENEDILLDTIIYKSIIIILY